MLKPAEHDLPAEDGGIDLLERASRVRWCDRHSTREHHYESRAQRRWRSAWSPRGAIGFDICDPNGKAIAVLTTPMRLSTSVPTHIRGDYLDAVAIGADDVATVVRAPIVRAR